MEGEIAHNNILLTLTQKLRLLNTLTKRFAELLPSFYKRPFLTGYNNIY